MLSWLMTSSILKKDIFFSIVKKFKLWNILRPSSDNVHFQYTFARPFDCEKGTCWWVTNEMDFNSRSKYLTHRPERPSRILLSCQPERAHGPPASAPIHWDCYCWLQSLTESEWFRYTCAYWCNGYVFLGQVQYIICVLIRWAATEFFRTVF